jgi:hypothetical protein
LAGNYSLGKARDVVVVAMSGDNPINAGARVQLERPEIAQSTNFPCPRIATRVYNYPAAVADMNGGGLPDARTEN